MSTGGWIGLGAAAVLLFWVVGAYNRLMALRTHIGDACRQVGTLLQARAAAADVLVKAASELMPSEQAALDAWLSAHQQVGAAVDALGAKPVVAALAAQLLGAEAAQAAAGARVSALIDQVPALQADSANQAVRESLRDLDARLVFARQLFNDSAQRYNDAVREWPTRVLARALGFGTAGRL
jgi:LemA protein